jgi:hypothetical protein
MASTFVLWLIGIASSLMFIKRAKLHFSNSRVIAASICLAAAGIAGGIFFSMPKSPACAAILANTPVGEAKGAMPGRVAWIYDSTAAKWGGLEDGHWWEDDNTNQSSVDSMMSRVIGLVSGKSDDAAAWDTLFRYYNQSHNRGNTGYVKGEKIAIKINLTFCNHSQSFCCVDTATYDLYKKLDYMYTSPQAMLALIRQLVHKAGVSPEDISIGDPIAYFPNQFYDYCHAEFPDVKYLDYAGKFGRTKAELSDVPVYWSSRPEGVKPDYIPATFTEATYLINLANMKSHMGAGITACAKNHYGSFLRLPDEDGYYDLHQSLAFLSPYMGSYRTLVDIMGHSHLGGKTLLYLVDGLYSGNHNNDTVPHKWNTAPFNGGWTSSIFGSQDPVAIESVLLDLFQLDEDSYQYPKIAGAEDYLVEAAQADNPPSGTFYDPNHANATDRLSSLGVFEHWNNPNDRQYSRNLSTGSGIELIFAREAASGIHSRIPRASVTGSNSLTILPGTDIAEIRVSQKQRVKCIILDSKGRNTKTALNGTIAAGRHQIHIKQALPGMPAGFYFVSLYIAEGADYRLKSTRVMRLPK